MTSNFHTRIKEERERLKLSAEAFGAMAGVRKASQYNYEKGENKPDIEYLSYLSLMGCDVMYIITGEVGANNLTTTEKQLITFFRSASPQVQAATLRTVDETLSITHMMIEEQNDK